MADGCGFLIVGVGSEHDPHRVLCYVNHVHACGIAVGEPNSRWPMATNVAAVAVF